MKLSYKVFSFFLSVIFVFSNFAFCQSLSDLLKQGDNYINVNFDNANAIKTYEKANELFPDNWEVLWRLSRVYTYAADEMPAKTNDQKDAQLAEYQKAFTFADQAVKLAPDKSVTYVRRAIVNGKIALFKGVFSVGKIVNSVKDDCEKAISLGNGGNFTQALAYYVLARTNAKVSEKWAPARAVLGLGWADNNKAISEYNIAIKLFPDFRMFYLDLAKSYIREDEYSKAKETLLKAINCPKKEINDDELLAESKNLLEKIKDK
jgi:tetratricopeptide (TPR) repeat protein